MEEISFIVAYKGEWGADNCYAEFAFQSILAPSDISLKGLEELVIRECHLDMLGFVSHVNSVHLVVGTDFEKKIKSLLQMRTDGDVTWYLDLVRYDKDVKTFPLIVDIVDCPVAYPFVVNAIAYDGASTSKAGASFSSNSCDEEAVENIMDCVVIEDSLFDKLPMSFDVKKGNLFTSKSSLQKVMHIIAIRKNFVFKVERSNGEFYVLRCEEPNCSRMIRASKIYRGELWVVRKYISTHSCSSVVFHNEHRQATSKIISELIKGDFSHGLATTARPKDVVSLMRDRHGVQVSYYKAQMACFLALESIRGDIAESYSSIPLLCDVIKDKNPGK